MTQHNNFSPNIDRQTCCSTPRARMLRTTWPRYDQHQQHQPTRPDNVATIRPASAASADTPRPASAASEEACFSFWTSRKPLTRKDRNLAQNKPLWQRCFYQFWPPPPPPPITPSSLCEVMSEAPSRGAFVMKFMVSGVFVFGLRPL